MPSSSWTFGKLKSREFKPKVAGKKKKTVFAHENTHHTRAALKVMLGCSESNVSYFMMSTHGIQGRCWYYGNRS